MVQSSASLVVVEERREELGGIWPGPDDVRRMSKRSLVRAPSVLNCEPGGVFISPVHDT
jgi:hypothetical protein